MPEENSDSSINPPTAPPSTRSDAVDAGGRITGTVLCRRCGYDLRELNVDANCPECGAAVEQSLQEDTLKYAEPAWLKKLLNGCRMYAIGTLGSMLVMLGSIFASMAIAAVAGATGDATNAQQSMGTIQLLAGLFGTIMTLIAVVGTWFITDKNPAESSSNGINARLLARIGLIMYLIMSPWGLYLGSGNTTAGAAPSMNLAVTIILGSTGLLLTIAAVIGWAAYYHYLARLLRRLPSASFAGQARVVKWGYAIAVGLTFLGSVGAGVMMQQGAGAFGGQGAPTAMNIAFMVVGLGTCGALGIFIIFEIWALILHLLLAQRLKSYITA